MGPKAPTWAQMHEWLTLRARQAAQSAGIEWTPEGLPEPVREVPAEEEGKEANAAQGNRDDRERGGSVCAGAGERCSRRRGDVRDAGICAKSAWRWISAAPITLKTKSMETHIENTAAPSVDVPRLVRLDVDQGGLLGSWKLICDDCPLRPHLEALGMELRACSAGIQTNIQGAVPLKDCEHYVKDSVAMDGKRITVRCRKEANKD